MTNETLKMRLETILRDIALSDNSEHHHAGVVIDTVQVLLDRGDDSLSCLADDCEEFLNTLGAG